MAQETLEVLGAFEAKYILAPFQSRSCLSTSVHFIKMVEKVG